MVKDWEANQDSPLKAKIFPKDLANFLDEMNKMGEVFKFNECN